MSLRVPTTTMYSRLERGLSTSLSRVQTLQGQLSSGSRIGKLSDDPVGAATGLRLRAQEADYAAYARSADDATASLGVTDNALQDVSGLLSQVRQAAISATNGGQGPDSRAALADQVADLRDQLGDLANAQYGGRAVFGGNRATAVSSTGTPPTWSFSGDGGSVTRQISPTTSMAVNVDGRDVFGFSAGSGKDVFAVLGRLEDAIRSGDPAALSGVQGELATRTADVHSALGRVGSMQNRVSAAVQVGAATTDRLVEQRSKVEDIDLAQTIMQLQSASSGYQAALGAVARADLPSLANFLH